MILKSHRWQKTAIAAAAFALFSLSASESYALSLGSIVVQSALGETLKAEIEIPDVTPDEAASLRVNVAPPSVFVAAGLDYNAAMAGLRTTVVKRPDGRLSIKVSGDRAINEPFVDMMLEVSSSSGRIVRDYTILLDPPTLKPPTPVPMKPITAPVFDSAPVQTRVIPLPTPTSQDAVKSSQPKPIPLPSAAQPPKVAANSEGQSGHQGQVVVKPGDSVSKIALRTKSGEVSLDQMLAAFLRVNPNSFPNGNFNNLRVGTVLDVPSPEQAKSIPNAEAEQIVIAQSKDFHEFKHAMAKDAPHVDVEAADRKISGVVDARVEVKKPVGASADKLTLSNGAVQAGSDEKKIAKELSQKDVEKRTAELEKTIAELSKTIAELKKINAGGAPSAPPGANTEKASVAPSVEVVKTPSPGTVASQPAPAVQKQDLAVQATEPTKAAPALATKDAQEPSLIDQIKESPVLPATAGISILLCGLALYQRQRKSRQNRRKLVDSAYAESQLAPDTYIGVDGGQVVDTSEGQSQASSSLNFSHSKLNIEDGIDPVAESDVYLAYGREAQAEEILKEALIIDPQRLAIHAKLLDIYEKRRDATRFSSIAQMALKLAGYDSPDWTRIRAQGLSIDPSNSLYLPQSVEAPVVEQTSSTQVEVSSPVSEFSVDSKLEMDLDFSYEDSPVAQVEIESASEDQSFAHTVDFDISEPAELQPEPSPQFAPPDQIDDPLDFSLDGLDLPSEPEPTVALMPDLDMDSPPVPVLVQPKDDVQSASSGDGSLLEFDLSGLDLDSVSNSGSKPVSNDAKKAEDHFQTKLDLAEEFISIGDVSGARALIEEIMDQSTGEIREKAERTLAELT